MLDLATLGWDDGWRAAFELHGVEGSEPGRVAVQHRGAYDVLTAQGDVRAHIANRLRRDSPRTELPVVGDWVVVDARRRRSTPSCRAEP